MKLQKKVNKTTFYTDFVNILNGVLQLSNREAEVFSIILRYNDEGFSNNVTHKTIRAYIKNKLGISEANLSRYLGTFKTKGLIIKGDNNKWVLNENITPTLTNNAVDITFILNVQEENEQEDTKINGDYSKGVSL